MKPTRVQTSKQVKAGDIIRFRKEGSRGRFGYGLVIRDQSHLKKDRSGFYYIKCFNNYAHIDYSPRVDYSAANYVFHSNMLLGDVVEIIGSLELETSYGFPTVGIDRIDAYLSQLDKRHSVFMKHASENMKRLYAKNEDRNHHQENGLLVSRWYEKHLQSQELSDTLLDEALKMFPSDKPGLEHIGPTVTKLVSNISKARKS